MSMIELEFQRRQIMADRTFRGNAINAPGAAHIAGFDVPRYATECVLLQKCLSDGLLRREPVRPVPLRRPLSAIGNKCRPI